MIVGIIGSQGSGKTALLTLIAHNDKDDGKRIISNIDWLKIKGEKIVKNVKELEEHDLNNVKMYIDEANLWGLDSRKSLSKQNYKILTEICQQVRKSGNELFYTTQRWGKIDVRLRDETDILIKVRKYIVVDGDKKYLVGSCKTSSEEKLFIEMKIYYLDLGTVKTKSFLANSLYGLYDTCQKQEVQYK